MLINYLLSIFDEKEKQQIIQEICIIVEDKYTKWHYKNWF